MAVIAIDGLARIIDLDASPIENVQRIYSEFADRHALNLDWAEAFATVADLPDIPVTATLINGWRLRCADTGLAYTKAIGGGVLRAAVGDPFTSNGGVEPRIVYERPVLAVGYSITGGGGDAASAAEVSAIVSAALDARGLSANQIGDRVWSQDRPPS